MEKNRPIQKIGDPVDAIMKLGSMFAMSDLFGCNKEK